MHSRSLTLALALTHANTRALFFKSELRLKSATEITFLMSYFSPGGNDNKLFIWDLRAPAEPEMKFHEHKAAVKGMAWSPHQVRSISLIFLHFFARVCSCYSTEIHLCEC